MENQYCEIESRDGVRLPYNIFPIFKESLPIAVFLTPLTPASFVDYAPVNCGSCHAIINPFCEVIHGSWVCVFCKKNNVLPQHYRNTGDVLPIEMVETSINYTMGNANENCILLVDCCTFDEERHKLCVEAVKEVLKGLKNAKVCVVYFGTNIEIVMGKTRYVFSGKQEYTRDELKSIFTKSGTMKTQSDALSKFFVPVKDLEFDETTLRKDPFPVMTGMRPLRCTGSALSFSASLLPGNAGKIFLFTQGPCTYGPGTVSSLSLKDQIRSHNDIVKGKALFVSHAQTFYQKLGSKLNGQGHTVDILAATIEDIGVYEMRPMVEVTGGTIIMAQDFCKEIYLTSIRKLMGRYALDGRIKVNTSPNTIFKGVLSHGLANQKEWRVGGILPNTTHCLLFEGVNPKSDELGYIQIMVQSQQEGLVNVRVTTLARSYSSSTERVGAGFDQEAASVLQARMFTSQSSLEEDIDLVRRIDKSLIRFMRKFATFTKEDPNSVCLPQTMPFFPQFTYFLRRSVVVQSEGNSPDETIYYRYILSKERITEALTIIVPVLTSYHYADGISPVDMDSRSLAPDTILLLDAFCNVLVWHGEHIHQWINEGLHLKEDYASLNNCIKEAEDAAREIVEKRIPTPQFVVTHANGSQERILKCRVNPSKQGSTLVTDDIDFETFYKFLCKIVVEG